MNATRQSLNTDKEKKTVFAFISTNFLFTRSSAAVNVFMFVRPRRLRLRCEEPGSVHGSPLAAVLRCVVEAASLNRVYLRDGGSERREERCSWQQQHFDSQLKSVVCHCQVEQPGVAPCLAFVLSATLI